MPPSCLSDMLSRQSMQLYSADMFSRALATIEFIMLRCLLLLISEFQLQWSVLVYFEVCTKPSISLFSYFFSRLPSVQIHSK